MLITLLCFTVLVLLIGGCLVYATRPSVPTWDLSRSTVLLTGGSTGIGLALAKQLIRHRVRHLVIAARRESVLQQAVSELQALARAQHSPTEVSYLVLDVSSSLTQVQRAIQQAQQQLCHGHAFDLLICNAGFAHPARFVDCTPAHADAMLATNLYGALYPMWAVLPTMLQARRGRIVLTSSLAARAPIAGYALYAATKAGLRALAHSVDMENACLGVRVQVVSPPDVHTPGYDAENTVKSPECAAISRWGGGKAIAAETMAQAMVRGIVSYRFDVTCGLDGAAVRLASGALEPATSVWTLAMECVLAGVLRFALAMFARVCYGIVRHVRSEEALVRLNEASAKVEEKPSSSDATAETMTTPVRKQQ